MKSKSELFFYKKGKKIRDNVIMVSILLLITLIPDFNRIGLTRIGLTILIASFLIFIISYTYLINKKIEINSKSIKIKKKIGKSNIILFDEIRRVTIREGMNIIGLNQFTMKIFGKGKNTKIIISDLDNKSKLINLIEKKGKEFGFNLIHLDLNDQVIGESNSHSVD